MGLKQQLAPDAAPFHGRSSVRQVAKSHTLRIDARQSEARFRALDEILSKNDWVTLGQLLEGPIVKGSQPTYLDEHEALELADTVPVVNTLSVGRNRIDMTACRHIKKEDFDKLDEAKRLRTGDVVLTVDGGTSIGKAAVFTNKELDSTIDSHVAVLRTSTLVTPTMLVLLLSSPLGQSQFQQAESGASGQTAVIEDDLRRFRFPAVGQAAMKAMEGELGSQLQEIDRRRIELQKAEEDAWAQFGEQLLNNR